MTPKQKALYLIEKFAPKMPNEDWLVKATDYASLCVDEIISEYQVEIPMSEFYDPDERLEFWEQVKKELEAM